MGVGRREGGGAEGGASSTTVGGGGDGSLGSSAGNGLCPLHKTSHTCSDRERLAYFGRVRVIIRGSTEISKKIKRFLTKSKGCRDKEICYWSTM